MNSLLKCEALYCRNDHRLKVLCLQSFFFVDFVTPDSTSKDRRKLPCLVELSLKPSRRGCDV